MSVEAPVVAISNRASGEFLSKGSNNALAVKFATLESETRNEHVSRSNLTASTHDALADIELRPWNTRKIAPPERSFQTYALWEGRVEKIGDESFFARLTEISGNKRNEEKAEFPVADIEADDMELFKVGAHFLFMVGYGIDRYGTHWRGTRIRFERVPNWSDDEIIDAYEETKALDSFFEAANRNSERPPTR
jgi:hypothetical protein